MQKIQNQELLSKTRLLRLRNLSACLGQPDLFSINKIQTIHSFLSQKKVIKSEEYFVNGLNFPTTAHISSYINQTLNIGRKENNNQCIYKIKFFTYDAFSRQDIIVDVSIPGSMDIKAFNLNGQPSKIQNYSNAYYSSFLRSLNPSPYHPSLRLFSYTTQFQAMEKFIKQFISFSKQNLLRTQLEQFEPYYDNDEEEYNLAVQIIIRYAVRNSLWNLIPIIQKELHKYFPLRQKIFDLQMAMIKQQYESILIKTADELMRENQEFALNRKYKQFQLRSLIRLQKNTQAKIMCIFLIRQGFIDEKTWSQILAYQIQKGQKLQFLKLINTCTSFFLDQQNFQKKFIQQIVPEPYRAEWTVKKSSKISHYPEFCNEFDYRFLQKFSKIKMYQNQMRKFQKQKSTLQILQKIDEALDNDILFEKYLIAFEKLVGWNNLMDLRNMCFWLESDFVINANSIQKSDFMEKSFRFMNEEFMEKNQQEPRKNLHQMSISKIRHNQDKNGQYFEGMSESDEEDYDNMRSLAPCSKRVPTKRRNNQPTKRQFAQNKILCHYTLQKIFNNVFNYLQLQTDCDSWASKLNFQEIPNLSREKKQLIAIVLIKKGWLHKKMNRFRKCEQCFKLVRKCTNNIIIGLVSCYQLAKLYLQHKNVKGVEFYIIELIRLLSAVGIEQFDVLPLWAKQILPFIMKNRSPKDLLNLDGCLKQIVQRWIKISQKDQIFNKN